jgi:arginase
VARTLTGPWLVGMRCRTADRSPGAMRGVESLTAVLGRRLGVAPRLIGTGGEPREAAFEEDLRNSRGCLLEAGGQVDDALAGDHLPVLVAGDCSICLTTLPAVVRHHPEARILWLDAHGDFNTPDSTPSGFLGGMCLAGACGRWETGLEDRGTIDPARVLLCGVRDFDAGERAGLEQSGALLVERPSLLAGMLRGAPVFVHLDLDVLDPSVFPAQHPVSGGLSDAGLRTLLAEVAEAADVVGVEITSFEAPEPQIEHRTLAELVAAIVDPLVSEAATA